MVAGDFFHQSANQLIDFVKLWFLWITLNQIRLVTESIKDKACRKKKTT